MTFNLVDLLSLHLSCRVCYILSINIGYTKHTVLYDKGTSRIEGGRFSRGNVYDAGRPISRPKLECAFLLMAPLFVCAVHADEGG